MLATIGDHLRKRRLDLGLLQREAVERLGVDHCTITYTLERELGRGGMARVYLAHDVRHDRLVALKVLHSQLAHALGPERFLREVRTIAQLQHPHILPVFDLVELEVFGCGVKLDTVPYQRGVP